MGAAAGGEAGGQTATGSEPTYFEFGKVVALGQRTVEVQTYDEGRRRLVQHSFALSREARADKVQVGDAVEVIYAAPMATAAGSGVAAGGGWVLRRLVLLAAGFPLAGPPPAGRRDGRNDARLPAGSVPPVRSTARSVTLPTAAAARAGVGPVAVDLGSAAKPKAAEVVEVPLGVGVEASARPVQPRAIAREAPSEECNRSALDWPTRPMSLAVLDFRYPTEREESHESGTTGGGSGTAVADLVFARLEQQASQAQQPDFALSRGDRQKLYRADFAGAARIGRQMGVDAVLAGTFVPIDGPVAADGYPGPRTWELRAGVVDTCTGQLLLRLYSQACAEGAQPGVAVAGAGSDEGQCHHLTVTAKQAMNPEMNVEAFRPPLDALLGPLEHNGAPVPEEGAQATVAEAGGGNVTLKLKAGVALRAGDELAIHATRLAKNPVTYTLQTLHEQEIGRVAITRVQGGMATGSYAGDVPARVGDVAVSLPQ